MLIYFHDYILIGCFLINRSYAFTMVLVISDNFFTPLTFHYSLPTNLWPPASKRDNRLYSSSKKRKQRHFRRNLKIRGTHIEKKWQLAKLRKKS